MNEKNERFLVGKLRHNVLEKMLREYVSDLDIKDKRVILGSKLGEDGAVIDMGDKYLVAKTDPITFATNEIGYYAVNVNVNDVVCLGAEPKWFQSTILLPEHSTTEEMVENIFKTIHDTCESMNITVIGGHTEITSKLDRPIVIGSLLGEVEKDKLVKTSGARIGDALILTKGIFIEGTSIIGREKEEDLMKKGLNQEFIDKCKNYLYNPGISIYKDALLANKYFTINSMHDPTEGGLANAVAEMSMAANIGVLIEENCINILPEPLKLSKIYNLNPLGTISSGSLLIAIENINDASLKLIDVFKKNGLFAEKIGIIVEKEKGLMIKQKNGEIKPMLFSSRDEITKIF